MHEKLFQLHRHHGKSQMNLNRHPLTQKGCASRPVEASSPSEKLRLSEFPLLLTMVRRRASNKALGLTIVAEGVETLDQEAFLKSEHCDQIQGFLYSKPVDGAEIPALLNMQFVNADAIPLAPGAFPQNNRAHKVKEAARSRRIRRTNRASAACLNPRPVF